LFFLTFDYQASGERDFVQKPDQDLGCLIVSLLDITSDDDG
jgi:hypothetical protein